MILPPNHLSRRQLLATALAAMAAPALAEAPDRSPRPERRRKKQAARAEGDAVAALVAAAKLGGGVSVAVGKVTQPSEIKAARK